jgi:predicted DNA-binding transcriptional regulator AlpA
VDEATGRRRLDLLHVLGDGADFAMVDRLLTWLDVDRGGVQPEDLMGLSEVAAMLGVSKQRLWNWTADPGKNFPAPIVTLGCGPIFHRPQVEQWKTGNTD